MDEIKTILRSLLSILFPPYTLPNACNE